MSEAVVSETKAPKIKTQVAWKCSVCGYIEKGYPEGLPPDYRCPICNAKAKKFVRIEIEV